MRQTGGDERMQIGEMAERTGLSLRTIRYYEEVGLVVPSARTAGGFRLYTEADVARLRLVKRVKALDFTLDETRSLFEVLNKLAGAPPPSERGDLLEQLKAWCQEVEWRCSLLREQLQIAEGLATSLDRELVARLGGEKR